MPHAVRRAAPLSAVLFALLLAACSPVNQENFDKIQTGMTRAEVEAILGKPDETSSASFGGFSGGSATWTSKDATITVQFLNDEVQFKQYSKGERTAE